jgi:hypothetical protein
MNVEQSIKIKLAGKAEVFEGNLPQWHIVRHKSHVTSPMMELEHLWYEASY